MITLGTNLILQCPIRLIEWSPILEPVFSKLSLESTQISNSSPQVLNSSQIPIKPDDLPQNIDEDSKPHDLPQNIEEDTKLLT